VLRAEFHHWTWGGNNLTSRHLKRHTCVDKTRIYMSTYKSHNRTYSILISTVYPSILAQLFITKKYIGELDYCLYYSVVVAKFICTYVRLNCCHGRTTVGSRSKIIFFSRLPRFEVNNKFVNRQHEQRSGQRTLACKKEKKLIHTRVCYIVIAP
jgi:hypothetical protein